MPRPEVVKGPFMLDGRIAFRLRCPGCGIVAVADDDQYHGRVSIQCEGCGYHETHDLSTAETRI